MTHRNGNLNVWYEFGHPIEAACRIHTSHLIMRVQPHRLLTVNTRQQRLIIAFVSKPSDIILSLLSASCYPVNFRTMANRALSRTVIFLDRRLTAVPSNVYYERLLRGGRVKEIFFTKNTTSHEMGGKILDCFPSLAGSDLCRWVF